MRGTTDKCEGEVPVVSPINSKPLKEIKQMLESGKSSSNSTSVDDTSHSLFLLQMLGMALGERREIVHSHTI